MKMRMSYRNLDEGCLRNQKGFTLVELLVVVGVFIALVSLTVPNYLATRPQRLLSAEANRMAAVIRHGRLLALRDNQKVYMEFLPEIDMYRLWSESGWRAYSDTIEGTVTGDPAGRNPDIGDYDGDFDGDGDYWWGTGGTPDAPTGTPEDPDVDLANRWIYNDTDGTYLDPDVLLMPTYPGNKPIRTVSPRLRIFVDGSGNVTNITRDLSDSGAVAGDNVVPLDVDIRMDNMTGFWNPAQPLGKRNGILSHFPLLFIVFFPDGTLACSWDSSVLPIGFINETIDLAPGALGATRIHLQVRSNEYNHESYNLFNPTLVVYGDEGPDEPLSAYNTLSLQKSNSEIYGRMIVVNNLSGRVVIRNFKPIDLDMSPVPFL